MIIEILNLSDLPPNLSTLRIVRFFYNSFPTKLISLTLPGSALSCLEESPLPSSLQSLYIEASYIYPVTADMFGKIALKTLHFLGKGDPVQTTSPVSNLLPPSVEDLRFSDTFKYALEVNMLPPSLTRLQFGHDYNTRIDEKVLPESLTELRFGAMFNEFVALPLNLKILHFGRCFDQPLNDLPQSLQKLVFGEKRRGRQEYMLFEERSCYFNRNLLLPPNLTHLKLGSSFLSTIFNIPSTLKKLCLTYPVQLRVALQKRHYIKKKICCSF